MDESSPPRPALFLRLMLILQPSRLCQLFSNLWVTDPHTAIPLDQLRFLSGLDRRGTSGAASRRKLRMFFNGGL